MESVRFPGVSLAQVAAPVPDYAKHRGQIACNGRSPEKAATAELDTFSRGVALHDASFAQHEKQDDDGSRQREDKDSET